MSNRTDLSPLQRAFLALEEMQARLDAVERDRTEPLAIVGLGCRFPGDAETPEAYWTLLREGREVVGEVPPDRWDLDAYYDPDPDVPGKMSTRMGAFLGPVDGFDAHFFNIAPREAVSQDPQQRLLLEVAWEALERAGMASERLSGSATGVFMAVTGNDYAQLHREAGGLEGIDAYYSSGIAHSMISGRLSYVFGLHGPSVTVDTACSSSLVALHLACQSLRNKECDAALAGGVNLILNPEPYVAFSKYRMLAPDGRCKTFDAAADGFVRGEGAAAVVLKRLSDAVRDGDPIWAVVRGSAVNQDGPSSGLTAPNGPAQEAVIRAALKQARLAPSDVGYVEAHGTGTSLGDPIEVQALGNVLGEGRAPERPVLLGSVKTNFGHLEAVAGLAGLIKVVLMLHHGEIAPHLHFNTPSPHIPWNRLPVRVQTERIPWTEATAPRVAGVSSFGFSGTNAHVILAEAPPRPVKAEATGAERPAHMFTLAARTETALRALAERHAAALEDTDEAALPDVCFSANTGRMPFEHRLAVVTDSVQALRNGLGAFVRGDEAPGLQTGSPVSGERARTVFLFTGQGSQYPGMGRRLYETQPVFREALDRCDALLRPHLERSILDVLYPGPEADPDLIHQTAYTQPALFALEYALYTLWRSWIGEPAAVMGHSVGEYVAACVAGVFSLEDGLALIAARGRLMQDLPEGGAMAAVSADEATVHAEVEKHGDALAIAAVNGPANVVVSGRRDAVERVTKVFEERGLEVKALKVSHAFHSPLMEPMLDAFEQAAGRVTYHAPRIRLVSNVTGTTAKASDVTTAAYWRRHVRAPVRFADSIASLREAGFRTWIEIGPHPVLLGMGQACLDEAEGLWVPALRRGKDDWETGLQSLAAFYVQGGSVDWAGFDRPYVRRRLVLPTYPFERKRYWVRPSAQTPRAAVRGTGHPLLGQRVRSPLDARQYTNVLSAGRLPVLDDHRLFGRAVLPATAYLEMALAAARDAFGTANVRMEDIGIHDALRVGDDEERMIQFVWTPERAGRAAWKLYSAASDTDDWLLHASGHVSSDPGAAPVAIPLSSVRDELPETITAEAHYERLRMAHLDFGPTLHGVAGIRRRDGEALGEIRLNEACRADAAAYQVHPALLDACLQVLAAAQPSGADASVLYVPVGIDALAVFRPFGETLWSHVVLDTATPAAGTLKADLTVLNDAGEAIAVLEGLRLQQIRADALAGSGSAADWLYALEWQPDETPEASSSAPGFDPPTRTASRLVSTFDALHDEYNLASYAVVSDALDDLSRGYIVHMMRTLGFDFAPGTPVDTERLAADLKIQKQHVRLFGRFLDILEEDDVLRREGTGWVVNAGPPVRSADALTTELDRLLVAHPAFEAELTLTRQCGPFLAEALTGEADPLQLLFPDGSSEVADRLYSESPFACAHSRTAAEAVRRAVEQAPAGRTVRILEIGAGTGGLTTFVVPALPADRVTYTFTDISPLFVSRAKEKFKAHPFMAYDALNIEEDPIRQGFDPQGYDLILAANVIHATADLRKTLDHVRHLLAPGGLFLMLEITRRVRWVDISFGMTEGWWRFVDADLRPDYPLILPDEWVTLLRETGFAEAILIPESDETPEQATILAQATDAPYASPGDWLLVADDGGAVEALAARLTERGERCVLVPSTEDDVAEVAARGGTWKGVVYGRALDAAEPQSLDDLEAAEAETVGGGLRLVQALLQMHAVPPLWLLTRGAQPAPGTSTVSAVQAPLWGLGRVVALEHPELRCTCVDLDPEAGPEDDANALLAVLDGNEREAQVACRRDGRYVARLAHAPQAQQQSHEGGPVRLGIAQAGTLEGLVLESVERPAPGPNEVEIRVRAAGLNFKDVLKTLGMAFGDTTPIGGECAGTVVRVGEGVHDVAVGDSVVALTTGSFATYATAPVEQVAPMPPRLRFEQAATIPIAYITASFTLMHLGRLKAGERVLIHAAAGGVGMAAVQLALAAGAEVFGTAGSPEKQAFLKSLGVHHVLHSRTLDFADEILAITDGEGVDVVLNSLSDEFIPKSIAVLKDRGRFLEIGKQGLLSDDDLAKLGRAIEYHIVDWSETLRDDPALIQGLFRQIVTDVEAERLQPLPHRAFPLDRAVDAFRFMAQARHIGKIVIQPPAGAGDAAAGLQVRPDATYLITGGLSGLGLRTAQWLVDRGATHLALLGRSAPSEAATEALDALRAGGVTVRTFRADVADEAALRAVFAAVERDLPAVRGVVHSAGVLDDGALMQQSWPRFATVMAPKVSGTWLLHTLTRSLPLDFFVLYSSVASLFGSAGQANHAAANVYMDALAHQRRAEGLPATTINWGAWSEIGAAADRGADARAEAGGLGVIPPDQGIALLERILEAGSAQVGVVPVQWPRFLQRFAGGRTPSFLAGMVAAAGTAPAARETTPAEAEPDVRRRLEAATPEQRKDLLTDFVAEAVHRVLGLDASEEVDPRRPLNEQGMDSLMAVELRNRLKTALALERALPATLVFDYPTVEAVTNYLLKDVLFPKTGEPDGAAAEPSVDDALSLLDNIEQLSDEEVERLLSK